METICHLFTIIYFACLPLFEGMEDSQNLQTACSRHPFKSQCMDGKRSQYTIRWFVMGSSCMSYPYGYCPENEVSHVALTMRTRKACEDFCVRNSSASENQSVIRNVISESVDKFMAPFSQNQVFFNFTCKRQEFMQMCAKNTPSQFTFRWFYENGTCLAYPYGFCLESRNSDTTPIALKSKEACEIICRPPGQLFIRPVTPIYEFAPKSNEFPKLTFWPFNTKSSEEENVSSQSVTNPLLIDKSSLPNNDTPSTSSLQNFATSTTATAATTSNAATLAVSAITAADLATTTRTTATLDTFSAAITPTTVSTTSTSTEFFPKKQLILLKDDKSEFNSNAIVTRVLELIKDNSEDTSLNETILSTLINSLMNASTEFTSTATNSQNNDTITLQPPLKWLTSSPQFAHNFNSSTVAPDDKETQSWPVEQKETFVQIIARKVCEMVDCESS